MSCVGDGLTAPDGPSSTQWFGGEDGAWFVPAKAAFRRWLAPTQPPTQPRLFARVRPFSAKSVLSRMVSEQSSDVVPGRRRVAALDHRLEAWLLRHALAVEAGGCAATAHPIGLTLEGLQARMARGRSGTRTP